MGGKTTETSIESFLALSTKVLGMVLRLKDADSFLVSNKKTVNKTAVICTTTNIVHASGTGFTIVCLFFHMLFLINKEHPSKKLQSNVSW